MKDIALLFVAGAILYIAIFEPQIRKEQRRMNDKNNNKKGSKYTGLLIFTVPAALLILFFISLAMGSRANGETLTIFVGDIGPQGSGTTHCAGSIELGYFIPVNIGTHKRDGNNMVLTPMGTTHERFIDAYANHATPDRPGFDLAYDIDRDGFITGNDYHELRALWLNDQKANPDMYGDYQRIPLEGAKPNNKYQPRTCVDVFHNETLDITKTLFQRCTHPDKKPGPWNGPVVMNGRPLGVACQ